MELSPSADSYRPTTFPAAAPVCRRIHSPLLSPFYAYPSPPPPLPPAMEPRPPPPPPPTATSVLDGRRVRPNLLCCRSAVGHLVGPAALAQEGRRPLALPVRGCLCHLAALLCVHQRCRIQRVVVARSHCWPFMRTTLLCVECLTGRPGLLLLLSAIVRAPSLQLAPTRANPDSARTRTTRTKLL